MYKKFLRSPFLSLIFLIILFFLINDINKYFGYIVKINEVKINDVETIKFNANGLILKNIYFNSIKFSNNVRNVKIWILSDKISYKNYDFSFQEDKIITLIDIENIKWIKILCKTNKGNKRWWDPQYEIRI